MDQVRPSTPEACRENALRFGPERFRAVFKVNDRHRHDWLATYAGFIQRLPS